MFRANHPLLRFGEVALAYQPLRLIKGLLSGISKHCPSFESLNAYQI